MVSYIVAYIVVGLVAAAYMPLAAALYYRSRRGTGFLPAGPGACDRVRDELSWWAGYGAEPRWACRLAEASPFGGPGRRTGLFYTAADAVLTAIARVGGRLAGRRTNTVRWCLAWAAMWPAGVTAWLVKRAAAARLNWAN